MNTLYGFMYLTLWVSGPHTLDSIPILRGVMHAPVDVGGSPTLDYMKVVYGFYHMALGFWKPVWCYAYTNWGCNLYSVLKKAEAIAEFSDRVPTSESNLLLLRASKGIPIQSGCLVGLTHRCSGPVRSLGFARYPQRSYFEIQLFSLKAPNGIPIQGRLFVGLGRSQPLE
jgi:hypothetical protein